MRNYILLILFILTGCGDSTSIFPIKDHKELKNIMVHNFKDNGKEFQSLATQLSNFKILRAINFQSGINGNGGIEVYFDSLERNSNGKTYIIQDLTDSNFLLDLQKEGISLSRIKNIKSRLNQLGCNSFFTFSTINPETGTSYIHTELRFTTWNGINFYYYKLFDKPLEPSMVEFFKTNMVNINEGEWQNKGGILDSNAIWYYKND